MRGLIIIQGINDKSGYLMPAIKDSTFKLDRYHRKIYINTEKYFDEVKRNLPFYLAWIPSKQKDYLADIWGFFTMKEIRRKIDREILYAVRELNEQGCEIDMLAHSLGTLIGLTAGNKKNPIRVNNFYCLNSPLGIESSIARLLVQRKVKSENQHFKCNKLFNLYGTGDYISSVVNKSKSILKKCATDYIAKSHDIGDDALDSHSATFSLNLLN